MDRIPSDPHHHFFLSAEIRWFIPGQIPHEILQWFLHGDERLKPSVRTDTYLLFPHAATSGVKFREGRFEIKSLVETLGQAEFGFGIGGAIETWEKWSLGGNSFPVRMQDVPKDDPAWIDVTKRRILRTFHTGSGEVSEQLPGEEAGAPGEGCYAELTEVEIGSDRFWTIGLESFSGSGKHPENLNRLAQYLFNEDRMKGMELGRFLHQANSLSYPEFLKNLTGS